MNTVTFTLLEAEVSLYAAQADGSLGAAIWSGQAAENFRAEERWLVKETRPSGARHPRQHPLVAQYQLSISRLWALPLADLIGFAPAADNYVLVVTWTDEDGGQWHRRTYYGVTIAGRTLAARDIESGHLDDQEFQAQYFVPDSGAPGTVPPAPVQAVPSFVRWVGLDGALTLYTYANFSFTAVADTTARATIERDGSAVQFAGAAGPVLATTLTGVQVIGLHDGLPASLPRLEFCYGSTVLAVITPDGFWAPALADGEMPADAPGQMLLNYDDVPVLTMQAGRAMALSWQMIT